MNRLTIIGNLTRAPEVRTAADGSVVTAFTVAVNRGSKNGHPMADYVRVSAWNKLGENCGRYLDKGKKVCVTGPVRASAYLGQDGTPRASLEMTAREVEFLTPRGETVEGSAPAVGNDGGYTEVETDDFPF